MSTSSGSLLIPIISAYWWRAARGRAPSKTSSQGSERRKWGGIDGHFLHRSRCSQGSWQRLPVAFCLPLGERDKQTEDETHREREREKERERAREREREREKWKLLGRSQCLAVLVAAQINFRFSQTGQNKFISRACCEHIRGVDDKQNERCDVQLPDIWLHFETYHYWWPDI